MGQYLSFDDYAAWNPHSLAPITHAVLLLRVPLELVEKHYAQWVSGHKDSTPLVTGLDGTISVERVDAPREALATLLPPQTPVEGRFLFVETVLPEWTAVFSSNPIAADGTIVGASELTEFVDYVYQAEGIDNAEYPTTVEIALHPGFGCEGDEIPGEMLRCPHPELRAHGRCWITLTTTPTLLAQGESSTVTLGHEQLPRVTETEGSYPITGCRVIVPDEDTVDESPFGDLEEAVEWLDEPFEDTDAETPDGCIGSYIWGLFSDEEIGIICLNTGMALEEEWRSVLPDSDEFYRSTALLVKPAQSGVDARAASAEDLLKYQYENRLGPDMIRAVTD